MKFSFRKIGSVLASTAMLSSTIALAAAANFPAPFVTSAGADVAIVHGGADAAYTDLVAVADVTSFLSTELAKKTASGGGGGKGTITGEAAPLFSGTKLYINDTLNTVINSLTKTDLPTILKDGSFSGDVDATFTQTITLGTNPRTVFARQPTSDKDPTYGIVTSTTTSNYIYNTTVTFNKAVNFTHADSKGQSINMFGQSFTVGSATSGTDLVLLKSAEKLSLSNEDPSKEVIIGGKTYTVELISASDTAATIKVTNSEGVSDSKTISEAASKKVNGLTIAVDTADETNFALSATVIAGAEKVTLTSGSAVSIGDEGTTLDGTIVTFTSSPASMTQMIVSMAAKDSDHDAILPGETFVDPVFGSFKLDLTSLSIPDTSTTARETIKVANSGDDKMQLTMTDMNGNEKTLQFAMNFSSHLGLYADSDGRNISVFERAQTFRNEYLVVGNENTGRLLKVSQITNSTTGHANDKVKFTDVFSGDVYESTLTADGTGTVTVGGQVYSLNYFGASTVSEDTRSIRLNYPASSAATAAVIYPTIQTSKGAKLAFYKPVVLNLSNWDGASNALATLRLPDGDGYTDVTIGGIGADANGTAFNLTCGSTVTILDSAVSTANEVTNVGCASGRLTYNFTAISGNHSVIRLNDPVTGAAIGAAAERPSYPALVIFEEKDDNSNYEALVVTLDPGTSASNGLDISDVSRTWLASTTSGSTTFRDTLASDSDITKEADLFGTIVSLDSNSAGHKTATINYPDEQVYVQIYGGEVSSAIDTGVSTGATATSLGSVAVTDSEASSVSGKNLVVVGGSCVNSVAAALLGVSSPTCGADFTAKTGVASGQYLIETFSRTGGKVATLVAGFNAGDTTNAAKALTTQAIDTTATKKYTGTTSTDVTASVA